MRCGESEKITHFVWTKDEFGESIRHLVSSNRWFFEQMCTKYYKMMLLAMSERSEMEEIVYALDSGI